MKIFRGNGWKIVSAVLVCMLGMLFVPGVAARSGDSPEKGTLVFQTASGGPIYVVNADGSDLRYLTTGIDPALSPDGQWVAFTRWDDTQHGALGSLWVINVDGTGERLILEDVSQPKAPVWSPDGTQIAISMQQGGRLEAEQTCSHSLPNEPIEDKEDIRVVVEIDGDGEIDTKLCYTLLPHPFWGLRVVDAATGDYEDLPGDRFSYAPDWDPVNDWHLVYDGEGGLVSLDLTRSESTTWALTNDPDDHTPVFSPDGKVIAVSYWQHDHWEIHVINSDGTGRIRLTKTPLRAIVEQGINGEETRSWNNVAPTWSPDGSQIAFFTDRTGRWEIWVMQADGSGQHPLFPQEMQTQLNLQYNGVDERMISWEAE
jgi:Tol biopolymer transport system component